ncbi:MAG: ABC transporter permease [Alphaproteobacteria bacterium]
MIARLRSIGLWARPEGRALRWAVFALAGLFSLPILAVIVNVFLPGQGTWAHLAETLLAEYIRNTAILAVATGIGVAVIGTATAWLVTMCRFPGRGLLEWALILPLAVPAYVLAYVYTDFLQAAGPVQSLIRDLTGLRTREYWFPEIRSLGGAVAMLMLVYYPYVYLIARAAFLEQCVCVLEVSRTLGCSGWESMRRVALPLARPAIAAGTALALMETLADFGTVSYFGVHTFTTGIYRTWYSLGDPVAAAQLSTALLGFVVLVLLFERLNRGQARFHQTGIRYRPLPSYELRGVRGWAATTACALPVLLGFLLPGALLLNMAVFEGDAQFGPRYLALVGNSVTLAATTACLAVPLSLLLAYGVRRQGTPAVRAAVRVAGLGYAVPGSVIAVGVLIPFALFDNSLDAWMRASFGVSTGLLLTGTIAGVVFACLVRFLAVSLHTVEASLAKISPSIDAAARTLGAGSLRTAATVHAPIMGGSLLTAWLIVFVDTMKELPATLLLRPFNFDTLAVQAYHLAQDERLAEASTAALAIVAVGLLPVLLLSRTIARSRPGQGADAVDAAPLADVPAIQRS